MTPELRKHFLESPRTRQIKDLLQYQGKKIHLNGLFGSALSLYADAVMEKKEHHLFVLGDKEKAAYFLNDLQNLNPDNKYILFFPHAYKAPYDEKMSDHVDVVARAEVLERLQRGRQSVIVTYPEALFEKVVSKKNLSNHIFEVKMGESYSIEDMRELLMDFEFENVDFVYEPGQFAIRGGIVDIFSYVNDYPFRIEFFDDEVETIRTFDPVSQLSKATMDYLAIVPNVQKTVRMQSRETIWQFIPERTNVWFESINGVNEVLKNEYSRAKNVYNTLSEKDNTLLVPAELFLHPDESLQQLINFNVLEWGQEKYFPAQEAVAFNLKPQPSFNKNFDLLIDDLKNNKKQKIETHIFSGQTKQTERLFKIFEDKEVEVDWTPQNLALKEGFVDLDLNVACYTDHQIFDRYYRFRLKESFRETKQAITLKELYDLQKGDYVTHVDHGVGRFSGLEIIDVNGKPQEAIRLIYKDNDVLYVSIHSLHRISKFTGKDGTQPSINKIGSAAWNNLKKKTKKKVKEVAFDLIQLYAKRKSKPGFQFAPDSYLQNELEASFIYEDTPDQLKATNDVKKDMESPTPMDRLICGDVGFGKTEIAIRAAFKAVADNKQVAMLVPTTILSMQHFKNFRERLKEFPCNVAYINRFKSYGKVKKTLEELKEGKIDIIIGTHKLVGKNVKFKDLGLLIIDEEQKFGVSVKDKLKTFKESVDTLTLTATPIPRTLQFSLLGARDLSIINTPPPNRQPVMTEVITLNEEIIQEAINYEVSRGGQVFFVHNRVQNIHEVKAMIERLVPNARVGIGHGQMDGKLLEQVMMDFVDGDFDVLLATTIIESGIDISNANTMIINEAQNFGLSDLHQLRGRVGRSNRKGFCYLIAPPIHLLPADSRRRLEALTQFSDLGSGFNIAMRDLDIRGAGDMLGAEQSGFIADIGLEMYQKILNEAVQELKENEFKDLFEEENNNRTDFVEECVLETDLELRIPENYVNQVNERLLLYRQLDNASTREELKEYRGMMRDRFGPVPQEVENLIKTMELRWMAKDIGFEKLILKQGKMIGHFIANQESPYYQSKKFSGVLEYIKRGPKEAKLSQKNDKLRLVFHPVNDTDTALGFIRELLEVIEEASASVEE